jgi:hypothetical protein
LGKIFQVVSLVEQIFLFPQVQHFTYSGIEAIHGKNLLNNLLVVSEMANPVAFGNANQHGAVSIFLYVCITV